MGKSTEANFEKRRPFAIYDWGPSLTKQSFADECNINSICKKFGLTGHERAVPLNGRPFFYGDVASAPSYREAVSVVATVRNRFSFLPAELRDRFKNNPEVLLEWMSKEENRAEAIKLGLISKPVDLQAGKGEEGAAPPPYRRYRCTCSATEGGHEGALTRASRPRVFSPPWLPTMGGFFLHLEANFLDDAGRISGGCIGGYGG